MATIFLPKDEVAAADASKYKFELSVDGKDMKQVKTGDIITVVLTLYKTYTQEPYTMHSMQDEIRYDSNFFELVPGSEILYSGVKSTDIAMIDNYREFYMNFLSFGGGEQWKPKTIIGSFQLKVIATTGMTKITNEDYLVSLPDGSGSYPCEANELNIYLTSDCLVQFETNGAGELNDIATTFGSKLTAPETPIFSGHQFEGWFKDKQLTQPWDFANDTIKGNTVLYAKWTKLPEIQPVGGDPTKERDYLHLLWLLLLIPAVFIDYLIWKRDRKAVERRYLDR
jgi:uncharacterized repeat protein (TIGR02543 family)